VEAVSAPGCVTVNRSSRLLEALPKYPQLGPRTKYIHGAFSAHQPQFKPLSDPRGAGGDRTNSVGLS